MGFLSWIPVVGPILDFAGSLISSSESSKASKRNADATLQAARETNATNVQIQQDINQANKELAEQQNLWNIEQWNRQNEYNSPANQKKLLQEAGLNPVLMSGGNFSPAESLQSADLANQQATQIQNPMSQAGPMQLQGELQAAQTIKGIVGSSTDVLKKFVEMRKTEVETGALKQVTPKQIQLLDAQIGHLLSDKSRIDKLTDAEFNKLVEEINIFQKQYVLLDKDIRNKELLNDSLEIQNELARRTFETMAKIPEAQLEHLLASAFLARANGRQANFLTGYFQQYGRTLPNNRVDQFVNLVFGELDKLGISGSSVVKFFSGNSSVNLGRSLVQLGKGVLSGAWNFGVGVFQQLSRYAWDDPYKSHK